MASSFENHRTAETLETTLFRWRREAFPPGVERLLVEHLRPEMARLGYAVPATDGYRLRSIEFAAGRVDLSPIEFSSDGILELREDYAVVKIQGGDFWMALEPDPFEAGEVGAVVAALSSVVGESCSLYWRNPGNQFSEERVLHLPIKPAFGWGVMRLRVAEHPEWKGTIAQLRLDLFNGVNPRGEGYIRWVRLIA